MNSHNLIFRVDGGTHLGMGHVVRCLALAEMLKSNFTIVFAVQKTSESVLKTIQKVIDKLIILPQTDNYMEDSLNFSQHLNPDDIVILDGYNFKTDYQKTIKEKKAKLVCIDDLHQWHFTADAVINHADGVSRSDYSAEDYTKFYLGMNYVLLRKPFLEAAEALKEIKEIKKVFIGMGAADADNHTQKFTEALLEVKDIEEVHLMLGSVNPHFKNIEQLIQSNKQVSIHSHLDISAKRLKEILQMCDVAICPASTISLECCSVGVGLISGYTSENQLDILKGLIKHKTVIDLGNMNELTAEGIKNNFKKLINRPDSFNDLIKNQKQMFDGKSPERLVYIFKELSGQKLHFRFAEESDVDLYFHWTNDPLVRINSYNQNVVIYDEHVKWFQSRLASDDCCFYLFLNEQNKPVGQVRIEKCVDEAIVGISIDKLFRGKSFGVEMLRIATRDYLDKKPGSFLAAYIKVENTLSYKIFLKAGFNNREMVTVKGSESYKLNKS
jgi:UDP-2,4-diacetamido-2,4,6-trideoxy-beta-L-altropyranose hydrolase